MAEFSSKSDASFSPTHAAGNKRSAPNISSSWVIMLLSGLIAMVVFLAATAKSGDKIQIAVASDDISTGAQITDDSWHAAELSIDKTQASRFVLWSDRDRFLGFQSAGPIAKGDPILKTQVRQAATTNGLSAMSIPIDSTRALGGELAAGDRVDVINDEKSVYAARGVEVLAVRTGTSGGALSSGNQFHIIVAVNADQALTIGAAIQSQKLDVVRSTGGVSPEKNSNSASNGSTSSTDTSNNATSTTTTTKAP